MLRNTFIGYDKKRNQMKIKRIKYNGNRTKQCTEEKFFKAYLIEQMTLCKVPVQPGIIGNEKADKETTKIIS